VKRIRGESGGGHESVREERERRGRGHEDLSSAHLLPCCSPASFRSALLLSIEEERMEEERIE
jgi:hypothetical protein